MKTDILDVMANLSNEEVFTPVKVVNEVLDLLPEKVWYNPHLKWFNPACKNGVWLREIYKKLFKNIRGVSINPQEREAHIKNNMLYGCSINTLCWKMTCKTLYAWVEDEKHICWENSHYVNNIINKKVIRNILINYDRSN